MKKEAKLLPHVQRLNMDMALGIILQSIVPYQICMMLLVFQVLCDNLWQMFVDQNLRKEEYHVILCYIFNVLLQIREF